MKIYFFFILFLFSATGLFSQIIGTPEGKDIDKISKERDTSTYTRANQKSTNNVSLKTGVISDYKIVSINRDTTYVDTTLSLQKEYKYNYLRKDEFNLVPFSNLGQTYNTLSHDFANTRLVPDFGARARHFNYSKIEDINYYHVPTPLTELMFKTAFEQGQLLDAFFTVNTSRQLNFSIAYKGMRSLGKYQHSITSTGNFRFTTNFRTKNNRYQFKGHIVTQDAWNEENGGILDEEIERFESGDPEFKDRSIFQVQFQNAENILKGERFYLNHVYNLVVQKDSVSSNRLQIGNIIAFENKYYQFDQSAQNDYFGPAYRSTALQDKVTLDEFHSQLNLEYENNIIGNLKFHLDYNNYNYGYDRVVVLSGQTIPNRLKGEILSAGGSYAKRIGDFNLQGDLGINISGDFEGNYLNAKAQYDLTEQNKLEFKINLSSRAPNYNYLLYQSDYENYNWSNKFNNVSTQQFAVDLTMQKLFDVQVDYTTLNNYTYFKQDPVADNLTKPFQYDGTINYIRVKLKKDLKFGKLGLDNTVLYQNVVAGEAVLNVPQLTTRNTFYYSNHFFKKALFLQTGIIFKYFTKYNMNAYDPLLAEFYVQNSQEFGGFPLMDFFINAKIRQTRIYLKAEHFNASFTGYNYYSAPNNPYRDFTVRFGLVWNFFL